MAIKAFCDGCETELKKGYKRVGFSGGGNTPQEYRELCFDCFHLWEKLVDPKKWDASIKGFSNMDEREKYQFARHIFNYENGDYICINGITTCSFAGCPQQIQEMYLAKAEHFYNWIKENTKTMKEENNAKRKAQLLKFLSPEIITPNNKLIIPREKETKNIFEGSDLEERPGILRSYMQKYWSNDIDNIILASEKCWKDIWNGKSTRILDKSLKEWLPYLNGNSLAMISNFFEIGYLKELEIISNRYWVNGSGISLAKDAYCLVNEDKDHEVKCSSHESQVPGSQKRNTAKHSQGVYITANWDRTTLKYILKFAFYNDKIHPEGDWRECGKTKMVVKQCYVDYQSVQIFPRVNNLSRFI